MKEYNVGVTALHFQLNFHLVKRLQEAKMERPIVFLLNIVDAIESCFYWWCSWIEEWKRSKIYKRQSACYSQSWHLKNHSGEPSAFKKEGEIMIVKIEHVEELKKYIEDIEILIKSDDVQMVLDAIDDVIVGNILANNDEPDEEGIKLQKIYDEIFNQN